MRTFLVVRSMGVGLAVLSATAWCACLSSSDTPGGSDAGALDSSTCTAFECTDGAPLVDGATPDANAPEASGDDDAAIDSPSALDAADAAEASNPNDLFVDSTSGVDTNSGKSGAPFKTFGKAFSVATSGVTVWVANGTYDPTSEGKSAALAVPDGVTVRAVNAGLATIDALQVSVTGASATIDGLVLDQGGGLTANNAVAASPTVTLANMQLKGGTAYDTTLAIAGNVKATVTSLSFSGSLRNGIVSIAGAADVVVTGGTFDGANTGTEAFGGGIIVVGGTAKLTLDGVTMKNSMCSAIGANGTSATTPVSVTLKNGTVIDGTGTADNCAAGGTIVLTQNVALVVDGSQIKNSRSAGVCVRNGTADHVSVTAQNGASFTNDVNAIASEPGTGSEATIVVNGATFTSNTGQGINWSGTGSIDLQATTMTANAVGVTVSTGAALTVHVRNSTFTNGTTYGVSAASPATLLTLDLGTTASPGGNTFTGNATSGLLVNIPAGQTANAAGNTWNASVEGADAAGHYTAGTIVNGPTATGTNYQMTNATTLDL